MITLLIIAVYLIPAFLVQPKLALANYGKAVRESEKRKANSVAFWQSLLWPAMLVMLRGHNAIEDKKSTDEALVEARKEIKASQYKDNPAMMEWDRAAGVLTTNVNPPHSKARFDELKFGDIGRRVRVKGKYEHREYKTGELKEISFYKGLHCVTLDGTGNIWMDADTNVTFLD